MVTRLCAERVGLHRGAARVLRDASIAVEPGEFVALIGPNGAGKSTLLRMLAAELRPDEGRCLLDGLDVHRSAGGLLACRRAVLPQDAVAGFPLPVHDIVALGRAPWRRRATPARNRQAITEAAQAMDLAPLMHRDYRSLSGGERQRVQLARVFAQIWDVHWDGQPRYLLLDEPTAGLDVGHQQRLLGAIRRVASRYIGILAVLHDLNLAAAYADRIGLLAQGRIVADGAPAHVLQAGRLESVYGAALAVHADPGTGRPTVSHQAAPRAKEPQARARR